MRRRASWAVSALAGALVGVTGCAVVPPGFACPAIGYVYTDPVQILLGLPMTGTETVSACLGEDCEVVPIRLGSNGMYAMPLVGSYVPADAIGINPGDAVTVAVTRFGTTYEHVVEVPYEVLEPGPCPSPVKFQPVVIT